MTDAEKLAALSKKVDDLTAKDVALEAVLEHVTASIFPTLVPQLALKILAAAREMEVKLPDGPAKLLIEENITTSSIALSAGCGGRPVLSRNRAVPTPRRTMVLAVNLVS
jgi:hypothetical protein